MAISASELSPAYRPTRAAQEALTPIYDWFTEGLDTNPLIEAATLLR